MPAHTPYGEVRSFDVAPAPVSAKSCACTYSQQSENYGVQLLPTNSDGVKME